MIFSSVRRTFEDVESKVREHLSAKSSHFFNLGIDKAINDLYHT